MKTAREQFDDIGEALCGLEGRVNSADEISFIVSMFRRLWDEGDDMPLSDEEAARIREIGNR